jgi:hypothetical protein
MSRRQYGITTVLAHDYTPFQNKDDYVEISETVEIVNGTRTMSTQDLVEAYLYGWMIVQFHITGYTQLYARYARARCGIYDRLFDLLQQHAKFGKIMHDIKINISSYLNHGRFLDRRMSGHTLSATSARDIYQLRDLVYDIGLRCLELFSSDTEHVQCLQRRFVYSSDITWPQRVTVPWNIQDWSDASTDYEIQPKVAMDQHFDFFITRRNGLLKNRMLRVS